jgi:hypothetical protein
LNTNTITDALVMAFREDADQWYGLVDHAEIVARIARVMGRWERDLRDPAGVVAELLRGSFDRDQTIEDRVKSLGPRCEPALRAALVGRDAGAAVKAARMLAEMGDDAGLGLLIAALADPDPERLDESDAWQIVDAIQVLQDRALEPLLSAIGAARDRAAQDRLLDALIAIDVNDDRVRDILVELVRAEPRRAGLLGDYGCDDPVVVGLLVQLAREHLARLRADLEDRDVFDVTAELVQALRRLDEAREEIAELDAIIEQRRQARDAAHRSARLEASPGPPNRPTLRRVRAGTIHAGAVAIANTRSVTSTPMMQHVLGREDGTPHRLRRRERGYLVRRRLRQRVEEHAHGDRLGGIEMTGSTG